MNQKKHDKGGNGQHTIRTQEISTTMTYDVFLYVVFELLEKNWFYFNNLEARLSTENSSSQKTDFDFLLKLFQHFSSIS